jgi:hypothetical protein
VKGGARIALLTLAAGALSAPLVAQTPPPGATIGDLKSRTVEVHKDAAASPSVE